MAIKQSVFSRYWQSGQAMTEFVIVASAVLVPLFLVLPILAKYGEVGQTAEVMARYAIWERSVWHENAGNTIEGGLPAGANASDAGYELPRRTENIIQYQTKSRLLAAPDAPITSNDAPLSEASLNPFLRDMHGKALVKIKETVVTLPGHERTPGWGYFFLGEVLDGIQYIYKAASFLGSNAANFSPNTNGYYYPDEPVSAPLVSIPLNNNPDGVKTFAGLDLVMTANGALLTDSWSSQGPIMFKTQTGGLVPSSLLNNKFLNVMRDVMGTFLLEDKIKQPRPGFSNGLDMGGYNTAPFNIGTADENLCDGDGLCSFNGNKEPDWSSMPAPQSIF